MGARITKRDLRDFHGADVEIIEMDRFEQPEPRRYSARPEPKQFSAGTGLLALVLLIPIAFAAICCLIVLAICLVGMWFVAQAMFHTLFSH
jgi:hypothetical protein